jgi:hypothetical protein
MNYDAVRQALNIVSDTTHIHFLYCAVGFLLATTLWLTLLTGIFVGRWYRKRTVQHSPQSENSLHEKVLMHP